MGGHSVRLRIESYFFGEFGRIFWSLNGPKAENFHDFELALQVRNMDQSTRNFA